MNISKVSKKKINKLINESHEPNEASDIEFKLKEVIEEFETAFPSPIVESTPNLKYNITHSNFHLELESVTTAFDYFPSYQND
jgi:hypothetical protein